MKVAALDLGTNTFLLLIAEVTAGKIDRVIHDEVRVIRLGQGVHETRRFHPDALKRAEQCFSDYSKIIRQHHVDRVLACATSAARDVVNGSELVTLASRYEIPVEIISGEREAELTFLGTIDESNPGSVVVIDVGGGSTELIAGEKQKLEARTSIDVGSVRLTEMFVTRNPIPEENLEAMEAYVEERISLAQEAFPVDFDAETKIIAVAGTPTTLATLEQGLAFESNRVHGFKLKVERLAHWIRELAALTVEERQKLAGMEPKRADVIVAGALVLMLAAEAFGAETLEVSVRGLRYGIARHLSLQGIK